MVRLTKKQALKEIGEREPISVLILNQDRWIQDDTLDLLSALDLPGVRKKIAEDGSNPKLLELLDWILEEEIMEEVVKKFHRKLFKRLERFYNPD